MLKKMQPANRIKRPTGWIVKKGGKMNGLPQVIATLIPIAGITMIIFIVWFAEQRKAKESFQRHELLRKIAEAPGDAAQRVLEMIREQEYEAKMRRYEGMKLGGLIAAAVGLALVPVLAMLEPHEPSWIIGLIPLLVGAALFIYITFLAPKPSRSAQE
jgi:hypothetical protein